MKKKIITTLFLMFSIQFIAFSSTAIAYKNKIIPSIGFKETYDSKVGYEDHDDFIHSIIPGLTYKLSDKNTQVDFSGLMNVSRYSQQKEYNGIDQTYALDFYHQYSERLKTGIKNNFIYDSNSKKSFKETGENLRTVDRIIYGISPYIILYLNENTETKLNYKIREINYQGYRHDDNYSDSITNSFGVSMKHDISERTSLGMSTSAELRSYDKDSGENHDDHYKVSLLTRHMLNEKTKIRFSFSGNHYHKNDVNEKSKTRQSINISAAAVHEINERLTINIFLGTGDQTTYDESGTLGAILTWRGETWKLSGGYKKDITPGARGYDLRRNKIYANGEYNISKKTMLGFRGVYVYSKETDNNNGDKKKYTYYSMEPYLQYKISKNSFITTNYSYGVYIDRNDNNDITRNQIYIMYAIKFPIEK